MSSIPSSSPFPVLNDTRPDDISLSPFVVSTTRGFLPRDEPLISLPSDFAALESLLRRMPIKTLDGSPGLLATGSFGDAVHNELPDLSDAVKRHAYDQVLMTALYRDYSFVASAYLLEPCHEHFIRDGTYGLARNKLPSNVAIPLNTVAQM
jgi:indoleamine 2,3-dioxygenase